MTSLAKRRQERSTLPAVPPWVVTWADMVSLLTTFFILLITFSSASPDLYYRLAGILPGQEGVLPDLVAPDIVPAPEHDQVLATHAVRGAHFPHTRPIDELLLNLTEMGQRETEEHIPFDLAEIDGELRLTFEPAVGFAPGKAVLEARLARALGELGRILESYPVAVVVEGHTDPRFQPTESVPNAELLSGLRAAAAAAALVEGSSLIARRIALVAVGSNRPRTDGRSASDRAANRRIEMRLVPFAEASAERSRRSKTPERGR